MRTFSLALAALLAVSSVSAQVITPRGVTGVPSGPAGPALNFTQTPQSMTAAYGQATATLQSALAAIAAVPETEATFANTIKAYETATAAWGRALYPIAFLSAVSPDKALRDAAVAIEQEASKVGIAISHREDLYKRFEAAVAKNETLDAADARLREATIKGFRENGFGLPAEQRERMKQAQERLAKLQSDFERNIAEHQDWLEVDREGLAGLSEDFVSGLEKTPEGKYKVTLDYPTYVPFMERAKNGEHRRALEAKFNNRAAEKNLPVLQEALSLRRELAQLLGYASYPAMMLKDRMAKSPEKVEAFLSRIKDAVLGRAKTDLDELLAAKRRDDPTATSINRWETAYYSRILKEERYSLDDEAVRPYFPVDRVVEGVMKVYQRTLGLTFRELKDGPKWHEDARLFEISDAATGRKIGHFYLDLFPRDGKYTHAAAFTIVQGRALEVDGYEEPVSAMVSNFPKPVAGKPALLGHDDVETFFHEFGHLMHQTLTKARYAAFSGTSVALDFVEAPSQMLENFAWEKSVLDEVSGHWQTGEKLPQEMFDKMLAAKRFMTGLHYARQVAFAAGDMVLHTLVPEKASEVFNDMMTKLSGIPTTPGTNFVASFGHLMGGYGAGYYSYLWSEVFADDIYTRFAADGVTSAKVGGEYRRSVLERGSEREEAESLREFLGREPNEEAFMKRLRGEPEAPAALSFDKGVDAATRASFERGIGKVPEGFTVEVRGHHWKENPQVHMTGPHGFRTIIYLHEADEALRRGRFRWWNPMTWFGPRVAWGDVEGNARALGQVLGDLAARAERWNRDGRPTA